MNDQGKTLKCRLGKHRCAAILRGGRACHGQHPARDCKLDRRQWKPERVLGVLCHEDCSLSEWCELCSCWHCVVCGPRDGCEATQLSTPSIVPATGASETPPAREPNALPQVAPRTATAWLKQFKVELLAKAKNREEEQKQSSASIEAPRIHLDPNQHVRHAWGPRTPSGQLPVGSKFMGFQACLPPTEKGTVWCPKDSQGSYVRQTARILPSGEVTPWFVPSMDAQVCEASADQATSAESGATCEASTSGEPT